MKKMFFMLLCAASVALVSCKSNDPSKQEPYLEEAVKMTSMTSQNACNRAQELGYKFVEGDEEEVYYMKYDPKTAGYDKNAYIGFEIDRDNQWFETMYYYYVAETNVVAAKAEEYTKRLGKTVNVAGKTINFAYAYIGNKKYESYDEYMQALPQATTADEVEVTWENKDVYDGYAELDLEYDEKGGGTFMFLDLIPDDPDIK